MKQIIFIHFVIILCKSLLFSQCTRSDTIISGILLSVPLIDVQKYQNAIGIDSIEKYLYLKTAVPICRCEFLIDTSLPEYAISDSVRIFTNPVRSLSFERYLNKKIYAYGMLDYGIFSDHKSTDLIYQPKCIATTTAINIINAHYSEQLQSYIDRTTGDNAPYSSASIISGKRSLENILEQIVPRLDTLWETCNHHINGRNIFGYVCMQFDVDATGTVKNANVVKATVRDNLLIEYLIGLVAKLKFDTKDNSFGNTTIRYPFVFQG